MSRPFVYPEHPEFKARVRFVQQELLGFARVRRKLSNNFADKQLAADMAEDRAKDIVLWVTSKPASRWPSKDFNIGYIVGVGAGTLATWLALAI